MDEDDLMIIGAKKKTEKCYDKNDPNECINYFNKNFISNKPENAKDAFIEMCYKGEVDKNFIRPTLWKIFLGILPFNSSLQEWKDKTTKLRSEYKTKLKSLNTLKKFQGDPLGNSKDAEWTSFFEENELRKIIVLDVNRTYQDKELFQSTQTKELLVNILFIWSKENKDVSYKQGMNEILAVLLFALYPFYFKREQSQSPEDVKESYLFFHNQDELQGDLFFLFEAVMNKGIRDLFDTSGLKTKEMVNFKKYELFQQQWTEEDSVHANQPPLNRRCGLIIKEKLRLVDEELHNHFIKIDLNCTIFLQRWLKCIFNREFHPKDVLVLWDAIMASDISDNATIPNESYSFMLIDFIAVAMINYIREDLLRKDQNDCFQRLFKYPPIETPVILVKLANQIKNLLFTKKKKREEKVKSESTKVNKTPVPFYPVVSQPAVEKVKPKLPEEVQIKKVEENLKKNQIVLDEDANVELVSRLTDIFNKYKNVFEPDDKSDFELIISTLKSNLNENNI